MAAVTAKNKKKPPPPPPPKRNKDVWVVAQYGFESGEPGDLVFGEGERIRVVKATESRDDWWEGEVRGVRGMFPANYCVAGE